jgi:hypothetical protein
LPFGVVSQSQYFSENDKSQITNHK